MGVFGTFLFVNIQEFLALKTANEELYYAICINMYLHLAISIINVIGIAFATPGNSGFFGLAFLIKDFLVHGFAIYFLLVVFGATSNEKTFPAADLNED